MKEKKEEEQQEHCGGACRGVTPPQKHMKTEDDKNWWIQFVPETRLLPIFAGGRAAPT